MNTSFFFKITLVIFLLTALSSCGKSELELDKERLRKEAADLKNKIDSTQMKIDTAMKDMDSLVRKVKRDSIAIDSALKKLDILKKK